jgi:hypothetical protein
MLSVFQRVTLPGVHERLKDPAVFAKEPHGPEPKL